jgi:hypothetical protein
VKPFLKEVAESILKAYPRPEVLTLVFPNRRAAIYFQKYFSDSLLKPSWAPRLITIEEFFSHQCNLNQPDHLSLIFRLYQVYQTVMGTQEPFDRFYFWGEMLLRDFEEVDKYLVNASQLFKDLSKLKELDESFDYLTEEQKQFLKDFWLHFEEKPSSNKEEFLKIWRKLPKIYASFSKSLKKDGLAYEGMIHREVAGNIKDLKTDFAANTIFIGFNALTSAEELVISKYVEAGASVYWDLDSYYLDNRSQEAGLFLRQYQRHPVLGKTFSSESYSHFLSDDKSICLTGVSQRIGQAKLITGQLEELIANGQFREGNTVIVLPDESMLLPMMNSLPEKLETVNVTMGYPLRSTPLYNLLDLVIEMQVQRKGQSFSHRQVTAILSHAYFLSLAGDEAQRMNDDIVKRNRVFVPFSELMASQSFMNEVFKVIEPNEASGYLLRIVEELGASFADRQGFDKEYAYHFHLHISRLHEILNSATQTTDWRGFQKLFRQVVLSQKIPFSGEPLKGLQIMGVLETRNLDFENVFILSMNEGMLPAPARQGSYIPHSIRKAYGLPTHEYQDAMYAYLFYRLLQRAETIQLYYNTEPDIIGNGEMSRYVQQLLLESGLKIKKSVLHNPVHIHEVKPILIPKTEEIMNLLSAYLKKSDGGDADRKLSPSVLNDYIECTFKFYLKHLALLKEADEVEEDLDARIFGNLLHQVMNWFYEELRKKNNEITEKDFEKIDERLEVLIGKAFRKLYYMKEDEEVIYEGQRVVVKEIVKEFAKRILEKDKSYAPFQLTMLEENFAEYIPIDETRKVKIGGNIDRADRKGDVVRVIDYKTGKDELNFESISSLFAHDGKRNKAAFQTMLYAYVYYLQHPIGKEQIQPGLLNRKNLFADNFTFGHEMGKGRSKVKITDAKPLLGEFEAHLKDTLAELFNPAIPFKQATDTLPCVFCSYKNICYRE